jgi:hypothetical protein
MRSEDFDEETALAAAKALSAVLAGRTHQRKILGHIITIPGQLGSALKVPTLISRLQSKVFNRRKSGLEDFQQLWGHPLGAYPIRSAEPDWLV